MLKYRRAYHTHTLTSTYKLHFKWCCIHYVVMHYAVMYYELCTYALHLCTMCLCTMRLCTMLLCTMYLCTMCLCTMLLCTMHLCTMYLCTMRLCTMLLCTMDLCTMHLCTMHYVLIFYFFYLWWKTSFHSLELNWQCENPLRLINKYDKCTYLSQSEWIRFQILKALVIWTLNFAIRFTFTCALHVQYRNICIIVIFLLTHLKWKLKKSKELLSKYFVNIQSFAQTSL